MLNNQRHLLVETYSLHLIVQSFAGPHEDQKPRNLMWTLKSQLTWSVDLSPSPDALRSWAAIVGFIGSQTQFWSFRITEDLPRTELLHFTCFCNNILPLVRIKFVAEIVKSYRAMCACIERSNNQVMNAAIKVLWKSRWANKKRRESNKIKFAKLYRRNIKRIPNSDSSSFYNPL